MAIIAALSVVYSNFGKKVLKLFLPSLNLLIIPVLQETPHPNTTLLI